MLFACGGKAAQTKEEPLRLPPSKPAAVRPNQEAPPELVAAGVALSVDKSCPSDVRAIANPLRMELVERGVRLSDNGAIRANLACDSDRACFAEVDWSGGASTAPAKPIAYLDVTRDAKYVDRCELDCVKPERAAPELARCFVESPQVVAAAKGRRMSWRLAADAGR